MKKKRKNPTDQRLLDLFKLCILQSNQTLTFSKLLVFINSKNGKCLDCNESYLHCECEKCFDCGFNRCLCKYDLIKKRYYSAYEILKIQIEAILLAYKYLEPLEFHQLIRLIDDTYLLTLQGFAKKYLSDSQYELFKKII